MITCRLTGTKGKGVKAHVVPRAFYELAPQSEGPLRLMSNAEGTFPKKLPVGIYDDSIVTIEGERIIGVWDDYAVKILIEGWSEFQAIKDGDVILGWQLPEYDYSLMKLFALSVLWRAHHSRHPAFSRVELGPHETVVRQILLAQNPGAPEQYSVNFVRWISEEFGPVFMGPFLEKYKDVNYYRIYCGRYVLYVKVDKRDTIEEFKEFQLGERRELFLIARELRKSKEWPVMQRIAKQNSLIRP